MSLPTLDLLLNPWRGGLGPPRQVKEVLRMKTPYHSRLWALALWLQESSCGLFLPTWPFAWSPWPSARVVVLCSQREDAAARGPMVCRLEAPAHSTLVILPDFPAGVEPGKRVF